MARSISLVLLSFIFLASGACSVTPDPAGQPLPMITFAHLQKLPVNVGLVQTKTDVQGYSDVFIVSPYDALRDYMHARFIPKGNRGELLAVIERADVKHSHETARNSVGSALGIGGLDVYEMSIRLRLDHMGAGGGVLQGSILSATRVVKVSEHASIAERERRQFEGAEGLFQDLDAQIQAIVLDEMNLRL